MILAALAVWFAAAEDAPIATTPKPIQNEAKLEAEAGPAEDMPFVAWCHGALEGHMNLAVRIQSILPLDDLTQKIGKAYLEGYEVALSLSPEAATKAGRAKAISARQAGWGIWEDSRAAPLNIAANTYLTWELPPRCEKAALAISHRPKLFSDLLIGLEPQPPGELAVRDTAETAATPPPAAAAAKTTPAAAPAAPVRKGLRAHIADLFKIPLPGATPTPAPAPASSTPPQ